MYNLFDKTLIISPHCDDETIGCGGLIHKLISLGKQVHIVVVAKSQVFSYNSNRVVPFEERFKEFTNAMSVLGDNITYEMLTEPTDYKFIDGELDTVPKKCYVTALDEVINNYRPTAVLFPYPSHHQDHKLVNEVSIAALRPTVSTNFIKLKAMYEYTYYDSWNINRTITGKLYVELDKVDINAKSKALECYKSQVQRDSRDLLDISAIIDLAKVRGREISTYYAEAFYPLNIIY